MEHFDEQPRNPGNESLPNVRSYHNFAVIVGGGSGIRMQTAVPKQFLPLNGRPVLMHTIEAFFNCEARPQIIVVLPKDYHSYWTQLCCDHRFNIAHQLVPGGETRFHSVKNGLDLVSNNENAIVAIHDAVRPLTATQIIDRSYSFAAQNGNAVTAVKSRDSVRLQKDGASAGILRDDIYLVQTPQTFTAPLIKQAYVQAHDVLFTDDASVAEKSGIKINLIEGSYRNIKITFPEDIAIAELLNGLK